MKMIHGVFTPGKPPQLTVEGVTGTGCMGHLEKFTKALGTEIESARTEDYYRTDSKLTASAGGGGDGGGIK